MPASGDLDAELDEHFDGDEFAGADITVVVPDRTRPIDYDGHVGPLLDRLADAGADVTALAGLGLHRAMTPDEIAPLRERVDAVGGDLLQHDAEADGLVEIDADVSEGRPGWPTLPAAFHPSVAGADAIVSVGTVEPHQYAGFSGGPKGVGIGCASARTIGAMHGLEFLRREGTRLGAVDDNPFHAAIWRLIDPLPAIYGLQVVPSSGETSERFAFGPIEDAFERAMEVASARFFLTLDGPQDWLHLPVSKGKASNFYQASRAATYAALAERSALADGATVVVEAACPEGMGTGAGERACAEALARGPDTLLEELESEREIETRGGEQRAYVIAKSLAQYDIVLVGAPVIEVLDEAGIPQYEDFDEAIGDLRFEGTGQKIDDVFHAVPQLAATCG